MRALSSEDIIISLEKVYADALLSGSKCVELRRRVPYLKTGVRVWFYSKIPVGCLVGVGILDDVAIAAPKVLWDAYSHCSGIGEDDFFEYFSGVSEGAALLFSSVSSLQEPIRLDVLKSLEDNFHPPQFFRRVKSKALLERLQCAALEAWVSPCDHHSPSIPPYSSGA
jgi:predicted transcriptional regulator